MTLTEIAKVVQIPKSTTLRLCKTLVDYKFLNYDDQTRKYFPGITLFELGGIVFRSFSLNKIASHYLTGLQKKLRLSIFMDAIHEDQILHLQKIEDPSIPFSINVGLRIGGKRPPHFGATGQLLMADLPDEEVRRLLKKFPFTAFTKNTITDKKTFMKKLRTIRSQGYNVDDGEIKVGLSAIAAPIADHTGKVIASVAAGYITESVDEKYKKKIIDQITKTSDDISKSIGFRRERKN